MPINRDKITKEQVEKALQCKTAEELMALAKAEGIELTKDEAEAYLLEMKDVELSDTELKKVAGGFCWTDVNPCTKMDPCKTRGTEI